MADIKIENYSEFARNNNRTMQLLESIAGDANDMLTSVSLVSPKEQLISENLGKLKKIDNTVGTITGAADISSEMLKLVDYFSEKALTITAMSNYIDIEVQKYNRGDTAKGGNYRFESRRLSTFVGC